MYRIIIDLLQSLRGRDECRGFLSGGRGMGTEVVVTAAWRRPAPPSPPLGRPSVGGGDPRREGKPYIAIAIVGVVVRTFLRPP